MFHLKGLKFFKLDELVPWLKRKCFEKYEYFEESGYILLNFMCILVLLPGTSLQGINEHIPGTRKCESQFVASVKPVCLLTLNSLHKGAGSYWCLPQTCMVVCIACLRVSSLRMSPTFVIGTKSLTCRTLSLCPVHLVIGWTNGLRLANGNQSPFRNQPHSFFACSTGIMVQSDCCRSRLRHLSPI